jgi:hypothetical protein
MLLFTIKKGGKEGKVFSLTYRASQKKEGK